MKVKLWFNFLLIVVLASCSNSKDNKRILPSSSGTINSLSIVIEDPLWKGEIGETLREEFTKPVTGLPQEEPLFSLSHIPPKAFSGFTKGSRLFIKIESSDEPYLKMVKDTFAEPQLGVFIGGSNSSDIAKMIEDNAGKLIRNFKETESNANIERISKSLKSSKVLEDKFGLDLKMPSVYRYAVEEDDFVWIRKEISHGSMEILVYEVPLHTIDKDTNVVGNIVKMRDSIGQKYIPGPEPDTYMVTEEAYAPYLYETKIDGKFAYLTKGTWEVKGAWMAGPFVNYAVRDEKNNRYLVMEGFVFKPKTPTKRNNVFELQSIFKSAKIQ